MRADVFGGRRKRLWIWPCGLKEIAEPCRADLKRFVIRSRRRAGWREFSARSSRLLVLAMLDAGHDRAPGPTRSFFRG